MKRRYSESNILDIRGTQKAESILEKHSHKSFMEMLKSTDKSKYDYHYFYELKFSGRMRCYYGGLNWITQNNRRRLRQGGMEIIYQLGDPMIAFDVLYTLTNIETLTIKGPIEYIPDGISRLINLKSLCLKGANIKHLPDELSKTNITSLSLSHCTIYDMNVYIPSLRCLSIRSCPIRTFPNVLFDMKDMKEVSLQSTHITDIPPHDFNLTIS